MLLEKSQTALYTRIDTVETAEGTLSAWICRQSGCPVWDAFLNSALYGHFYQTSMWAQARVLDGWKPLITIFTQNGRCS